MTRKDYILIAAALASARPVASAPQVAQWRRDCRAHADALARDNPRFDRARFLKACGITTEG